MKKIGFLLLFFSLSLSFSSFHLEHTEKPQETQGLVKWLTWEEAMEKFEKEERKIFVDVYTEWCKWCKTMDTATFDKPHIAEYLNEHYYPVKFDAEHKEDIIFNGKTFKFVKGGRRGFHSLAAEITRGRLSFPTSVFLDENLQVIQPIPGFKDADTFEQIMTYFAENEHKKTPWETYKNDYVPMLPAKN